MLEDRLTSLIPSDSPLREVVLYTLTLPSSRIRPRIIFDIAESDEAALDPACALELIHTYSLIHDDLPCMDDDEMRRGAKALHIIHGDGIAILAGDYLLSLAFRVLAEAPHLTADQRLELTRLYADAACRMADGQYLDLTKHTDGDAIASHKTGALFEAAFVCGALIGGKGPPDLYRKGGNSFGLAYQLLDDLNDGDAVEGIETIKRLEEYRCCFAPLIGDYTNTEVK
jgi:geranylgeranyl diphosphate synthase type II